MKRAGTRFVWAAFVLIVALSGGTLLGETSAQGTDDGTIGVSGSVTTCTQPLDVGAVNPNEVCEAIEGIGFTFADEAGEVITYCTAEAADVPEPKAAGCAIDIPYSSTVTVTLDESTIPDGYYLYSQNPQSFTAPDGPPTGLLSHPFFVILPLEHAVDVYTVSAIVMTCSELPEGGPYYASPLCQPTVGARVTYSTELGELLWSCTPTENPYCSVDVPYSGTIIVTLDESTIPDGYYLYGTENPQAFIAPPGPPDGVYGAPFFMLLPVEAVVPSETPDDMDTGEAAPTFEAPSVEGRTAALYTGDCDAIGDEVATLNDVLPEDGDMVGDEKAITAEMSNTTGARFFLDVAIDEGMALVVFEDETTDTPIVCGELGGANTHDGVLPIGLGEVDASSFVGTAVLSYNDVDETTTDVIVVISEELLPEPTGTPNS